MQHPPPLPGADIRTRVFMLSNCGDDRPRRMRALRFSTLLPSPLADLHSAHAGIGALDLAAGPPRTTTPGARGHRQSRPATVRPDPYNPQPQNIAPRTGMTDLEPDYDRSRHGLRPISVRSTTDLDTEPDRSRRGSGPISRKGAGGGQPRGPLQAAAASSTRSFSSLVPTEMRTPSPAKGRTSTPAAAKCSARRAVASPTPSQ